MSNGMHGMYQMPRFVWAWLMTDALMSSAAEWGLRCRD